MGAKQTSQLIPLCHNIPMDHVRVNVSLDPERPVVKIWGEAWCHGKTGGTLTPSCSCAVWVSSHEHVQNSDCMIPVHPGCMGSASARCVNKPTVPTCTTRIGTT